jgi:hypothetical protein
MNDYTSNPNDWIDEQATFEQFGYYSTDLSYGSGQHIISICQHCGTSRNIERRRLTPHCYVCAKKLAAPKISKARKGTPRNVGYLITPRELSPHIHIEKTIHLFGYNPQLLTDNSNRMVVGFCTTCGKERISKMQALAGKPECRDCVSKNPEVRKRNSAARYRLLEERGHPNKGGTFSEQAKQNMRKPHPSIQGANHYMYGKVPPKGRGTWYTTLHGINIWMRSSYEVSFAEWLDASGILWDYENKAFPIECTIDGRSTQNTYRPDFYLPEYDRYIEVKGYWRKIGKLKYDAFIFQYPNIEIDVWEGNLLRFVGAIK